jgi:hypothetical protein
MSKAIKELVQRAKFLNDMPDKKINIILDNAKLNAHIHGISDVIDSYKKPLDLDIKLRADTLIPTSEAREFIVRPALYDYCKEPIDVIEAQWDLSIAPHIFHLHTFIRKFYKERSLGDFEGATRTHTDIRLLIDNFQHDDVLKLYKCFHTQSPLPASLAVWYVDIFEIVDRINMFFNVTNSANLSETYEMFSCINKLIATTSFNIYQAANNTNLINQLINQLKELELFWKNMEKNFSSLPQNLKLKLSGAGVKFTYKTRREVRNVQKEFTVNKCMEEIV